MNKEYEIMRRKFLQAGLVVGLAPLLGYIRASHAGAVVGATEFTQIFNMLQLIMSYVEQAEQTITQMRSYQAMLKNLEKMTPSSMLDNAATALWRNEHMNKTFGDVRTVYINGQRIAHSASNIDAQFKNRNPGYRGFTSGFNYSQAYSDWSDNTLSSVKNSLALVTAQHENFATEEGMVAELNAQSQSASGQLQSLQAGQQISLAMVGQLQKLRQLNMAQMNAQNAFMAGEQSKKDADNASMDRVLGQIPRPRSIKGN